MDNLESTQLVLESIFPLLPQALYMMQRDVSPAMFLDLGEGTRASILHDLVMNEGSRRLSDGGKVYVTSASGLRHFVLPDAKVRVKKGDRQSLTIANNCTRQTKEWTSYQLALEGVDDPRTYWHLVYVPDPYWMTIHRCGLGLYHGRVPIVWSDIDVADWYGQGGPVMEPFAPERPTPVLKLRPEMAPLLAEEDNATS